MSTNSMHEISKQLHIIRLHCFGQRKRYPLAEKFTPLELQWRFKNTKWKQNNQKFSHKVQCSRAK